MENLSRAALEAQHVARRRYVTEELNPWQENGEQWRAIKVTVPDSIASHSREQVAYFGKVGLLRRHGYTVDVMGGASGLNYAADYRNVDGIVVPMNRRVYAADADQQKIPEPVLVAIDIGDISFRRNRCASLQLRARSA